MIFVGHDINESLRDDNLLNLSYAIPGKYTHVLSYVGKDAHGFAYAVEMNADKNQTFNIDLNGFSVGGEFYLYCLGSDFAKKSCPSHHHIYGMNTYDYMLAKRLNPVLKKGLMRYEEQLIKTMENDLRKGYAFQVPVEIDLETPFRKVIPLIEDGRKNGAD